MPPFSVGIAQVEERLRNLRRRLNLFVLQDAAYLSGSLVVLAAGLMVVLAMRDQATIFAAALWAATAASGAAGVGAILRLRRRWLSADAVVHLVDRQAALDDRLATLLFEPTRASSLKDLLLEQTLAATPRWDIDVLAPRRVPRSVLLLAGSVAALIVTAYFARPPATPTALAAQPSSPPPLGNAHRDDNAAPGKQVLEATGAGATGAGQHAPGATSSHGEGDRIMQFGSATQAASDSHRDGAHPAGNGSGGAANASRSGSSSEAGGGSAGEAEPQQIAAKLQDAIRAALGGEKLAAHQGTDRPAASQPRSADGMEEARRTAAATDPQRNSAGDAGRSGRPPESAGGRPGGAGATASAGRQDDGSAAQLFAEQAQPAAHSGQPSQSLALKLAAFSSAASGQAEPRQRDEAAVPTGFGGGGRSPSAASEEQIPDAPVQKADIAPEHEALVRRIFTRDE